MLRLRSVGAPAALWRITTMSMPIASRLRAVSSRVSPLLTELAFCVNSMTSALSRLAARVKLLRVRVLSSKNRLTTTLPRSGGAFLTERVLISSKPCGRVEDVRDLLDAQVPQAEQMLSLPLERFVPL